MTFSFTSAKLAYVDPSNDNYRYARADYLIDLLEEVEAELNAVGTSAVFDTDIIATDTIVDGAITAAKMNLSSPTSDNEPATKKYADDEFSDNAALLFAFQSPNTTDDNGSKLYPDKFDFDTAVITEKIYQAQTDGFLMAIAHAPYNSESTPVVTGWYTRMVVYVGDRSVAGCRPNGWTDGDRNSWVWQDELDNSGLAAFYDQSVKYGSLTAVVPVKKDQYFKVVICGSWSAGAWYGRGNYGSTDDIWYIDSTIKFLPIGTNILRPEVQS